MELWMDKYYDKFGDVVPTHEMNLTSLEEIEEVAKKCVEAGKDAFELFGLEENSEKIY